MILYLSYVQFSFIFLCWTYCMSTEIPKGACVYVRDSKDEETGFISLITITGPLEHAQTAKANGLR